MTTPAELFDRFRARARTDIHWTTKDLIHAQAGVPADEVAALFTRSEVGLACSSCDDGAAA